MPTASYTPYQNKRSLFSTDLHLRKRKELTGVLLPSLENMFQKEQTEQNYLRYLEELKATPTTVKGSDQISPTAMKSLIRPTLHNANKKMLIPAFRRGLVTQTIEPTSQRLS